MGRRGEEVAGYVCRLCLPAREIKVVVGTAHVGEFRFRHVLLTWANRRDWRPDTKGMSISRSRRIWEGRKCDQTRKKVSEQGEKGPRSKVKRT